MAKRAALTLRAREGGWKGKKKSVHPLKALEEVHKLSQCSYACIRVTVPLKESVDRVETERGSESGGMRTKRWRRKEEYKGISAKWESDGAIVSL